MSETTSDRFNWREELGLLEVRKELVADAVAREHVRGVVRIALDQVVGPGREHHIASVPADGISTITLHPASSPATITFNWKTPTGAQSVATVTGTDWSMASS